MSNATIAYLGPQGTYSDEAARLFAKKMGCENPEFVECPSFNEVHEAVDRGRCEFGVMPIENSLEGVVTATLDTLAFKGGVSIMGSTVLNIHHCLMVNPESTLDKVTTIASHPQALAQCRRWLDAHFPSVPRLAVSSTAEGARKAAQDKTVAGISSKFAGQLFDCTIAEEGIEDHYGNQTRFVLIARQGHEPVLESDNMKTTFSDNTQLKLAFNPGAAVYIFPNVCATLSFGLGGIQYTSVTQKDDAGNKIGTRKASNMRFRLNVAAINFGMTVHLWDKKKK